MSFTQKQQIALSRAAPNQRARMAALFRAQRSSKSNGRNGNGKKAASRSMGEIVLAPGTGRVPRRPFGGISARGLRCWDAFDPCHAPLPRSVGPYAVVRTTRIFKTGKRVIVFGVAVEPDGSWTNTCAWASNNSTNPINGVNNTDVFTLPVPGVKTGTSSTFTVVPAAMSVQVMNPNPLQTTSGLVYAGVCPTQLSLVGNSRTWEEFESEFTSYMKPRLMSAPKLALRGVQMNSYPMNMAALANFEGCVDISDGPVTWARTGNKSDEQYLTGLAPMVVVNTDGAELTYAVTVEYRVRFDISNPAVATHVHHGVTPDSVWDNMLKAATAMGNGVRDIADVVATAGQAVSALRNVRMPMLE